MVTRGKMVTKWQNRPEFQAQRPIFRSIKRALLLNNQPFLLNKRALLLNNQPFLLNKRALLLNNQPLLLNKRALLLNNQPLFGEHQPVTLLSPLSPYKNRVQPFVHRHSDTLTPYTQKI